MVDLPGRVPKRNVLSEWGEDHCCYNLCGLQTDRKWQLKSQLIPVGRDQPHQGRLMTKGTHLGKLNA